jgi:hypothetical protein
MKKLICILILTLSNNGFSNTNFASITFSENESFSSKYNASNGDHAIYNNNSTLNQTFEKNSTSEITPEQKQKAREEAREIVEKFEKRKEEYSPLFDDKELIVVIVVFFASLFLMAQLERFIFDTEGEVFHQIISFIIAAIFYFLFALLIVRALGVTDIILIATLISLTVFVLPISRYYQRRHYVDNINKASTKGTEEKEILKEKQDSDQMTLDFNVQNAHEISVEEISSDIQNEEFRRIDRNELKNEIIEEIGYGSYERWYQLTSKMIFESKKSREKTFDELISYGLNKEIAKKMIELFKK